MLINRIWGLFLHPTREWEQIKIEQEQGTKPYLLYILLLSAIPPIAGYIGATQTGWQIGDGAVTKLTIESTVPLCIASYLAIVAGIYVTGIAIDWMRDTYTDLEQHELAGSALAVYVSTPLLVLSIVGVYPIIWLGLITLVIAASYSAYLLYKGVPIVFQIPKERGMMFASAILTFALVVAVALIITTVIIWAVGFDPVFTN